MTSRARLCFAAHAWKDFCPERVPQREARLCCIFLTPWSVWSRPTCPGSCLDLFGSQQRELGEQDLQATAVTVGEEGHARGDPAPDRVRLPDASA
jgi:hypothetical protein